MSGDNYAIDIVNLCKDFRVHHRSYSSLKSHAAALAKNLARRGSASPFETRRVLEGVTFRVAQGESVAIIGRNGSGKSTLLSILSRVYLPTEGEVRLRGRMISLLELGAGFNPELTGTENVFFNGIILGLTQDQVAERYDQILAFAELAPGTMDLPVRMYSSGMQIRLGFSIAIHMDADLLLLDEGLSVGDAGFQAKSMARMQQFKAEGKTMLIVTHDINSLPLLADRAIWLEKGRVMCDGDVRTVVKAYRESYIQADALAAK